MRPVGRGRQRGHAASRGRSWRGRSWSVPRRSPRGVHRHRADRRTGSREERRNAPVRAARVGSSPRPWQERGRAPALRRPVVRPHHPTGRSVTRSTRPTRAAPRPTRRASSTPPCQHPPGGDATTAPAVLVKPGVIRVGLLVGRPEWPASGRLTVSAGAGDPSDGNETATGRLPPTPGNRPGWHDSQDIPSSWSTARRAAATSGPAANTSLCDGQSSSQPVTTAPASRAMSPPAAWSHGWSIASK